MDQDRLATELQLLHAQCYGWALACCGNRREDAEDVLHDVYVGVLGNGLRFNGASTLRTWLFGVIRNKARAKRRGERDDDTIRSAFEDILARRRRSRSAIRRFVPPAPAAGLVLAAGIGYRAVTNPRQRLVVPNDVGVQPPTRCSSRWIASSRSSGRSSVRRWVSWCASRTR